MSVSETIKTVHLKERLLALYNSRRFTTALAFSLVVVALLLGAFTYLTLTGWMPFTPGRVLNRWLLVGNGISVSLLFVVILWRVVRIIIARISGAAGAKLHVRLVTMFAIVAVMPAIIVAVFAYATLSRGLDQWFSDSTRFIFYNADTIAETYINEHTQALRDDVLTIAYELDNAPHSVVVAKNELKDLLTKQAISHSIPSIYVIEANGLVIAKSLATFAPPLDWPDRQYFERADNGLPALWIDTSQGQLRALTKLSSRPDAYLYVARTLNQNMLQYLINARASLYEFQNQEKDRNSFQIAFALVYVAVAFITLLAAMWLGLWAANRLVTPITRLVQASERVSNGDLSARVEEGDSNDELDTLSSAFNRMTSQLESQRSDLVEANHQLDQRRQFTEAVLSGVSAGVLGVDKEGRINHANRAALRFFGKTEEQLIGRDISEAFPEMAGIVSNAVRHPEHIAHGQILIRQRGLDRTLNVRATGEVAEADLGGYVLTFDDITELVQAQRTSAWADVARRIAHEIKNPLTPIQLSAERLRRKYSGEITTDPDVFAQCTETIIRQVGDIGRMVDEFSSFARMPTAVLKPVELNEIVRQGVFLQRLAHPEIVYTLSTAETPIIINCDARLVSQALTNILKNAVEAIRGQHESEREEQAHSTSEPTPIGKILITIEKVENFVAVSVTDSGCGLPQVDRSRLTEPYMTTRTKGTGLGLAIVNKVMEDHGGRLVLEDAPVSADWESGARVRLLFPVSEELEHQAAAKRGLSDAELEKEAVNGV